MHTRGLIVLLVEDEPNDAFFFCRAASASRHVHRVEVVGDGREAIQYLLGVGEYSDREAHPFPEIVVSDLRMPGLDGFDLLRWIRENQSLARLPVVIFSSSGLLADVREALSLGAHSCLVKPSDTHELNDLVEALFRYWRLCRLDNREVSNRVE